MTRAQRREWLLREVLLQQRWINEHGGSLSAYVARYGAAGSPGCYGAGGEAIWQADQNALHRLEREYTAAVAAATRRRA